MPIYLRERGRTNHLSNLCLIECLSAICNHIFPRKFCSTIKNKLNLVEQVNELNNYFENNNVPWRIIWNLSDYANRTTLNKVMTFLKGHPLIDIFVFGGMFDNSHAVTFVKKPIGVDGICENGVPINLDQEINGRWLPVLRFRT